MPIWFIALWLIVLAVAIFSRSMIANLALIFVCVLGFKQALGLPDADVVRWGVAGMYACGIGFAGIELLVKVDKI